MEANKTAVTSPQSYGIFWRMPDVCRATGLQKSTLYKLMAEGKFPSSVKLGQRCVAWESKNVIAWCEARVAASQKA